MNIYEIARLRVVAMGLEQDKRFLISKAADALENRQREIEALRQICEKQAEMNAKVETMALELDEVKAARDALLQILKAQGDCELCKHDGTHLPCAGEKVMLECEDCGYEKNICCGCGGAHWEWRGVQQPSQESEWKQRVMQTFCGDVDA